MARTPNFPANPDVLRWARELAGWDVDGLANRLKVKPGVVESWESGDQSPSLAKARQLADLYRRPVATFLVAGPPQNDIPAVADFRGLVEEGFGRALRRELQRAERRREIMLRLAGPRPFALADVEFDGDVTVSAADVRAKLGITVKDQVSASDSTAALGLFTGALADAGALVFTMSRIDTADCRGFSVYNDLYPVIMINGADPPQARSFTLFHELGHLLQRTSGVCTLFGPSAAETVSNRFAAEMLMPERTFLGRLGDRDPLEALKDLANMFNVSQEAAAVRLRVLGRISQDELDSVRNEAAERLAERRQRQRDTPGGPPHYRTQLRNLGEQFVTTVVDAREEQRITEVEAAHYLESKLTTIDGMENELVKRAAAS